jgi:hypothetical protein
MQIPEGSKIGVLRDGLGKTVAEISIGKTATVGPLKGIPVWGGGTGVKLLFLIPLHLPGWVVNKSARRQAGAFVLGPEESFTLRGPSQEEAVYCFNAVSVVEVVVERGSLCGFCRSRFKDGDAGWLPLASKSPGGDRVLCISCAQAWEILPSEEASARGSGDRDDRGEKHS